MSGKDNNVIRDLEGTWKYLQLDIAVEQPI
jgi:hypothetical protein